MLETIAALAPSGVLYFGVWPIIRAESATVGVRHSIHNLVVARTLAADGVGCRIYDAVYYMVCVCGGWIGRLAE